MQTPAMALEDQELIKVRLRQAYGFGISSQEISYIARMQAKSDREKVCMCVCAQSVRHK
jgi:hypothetical protein